MRNQHDHPGQGAGETGNRNKVRWEGLEEQRAGLQRFLNARCEDPNDVQDIIQESFLRAARYRRGFMKPSRLRGWLFRIACNVQADLMRGRLRGPSFGLAPEVLESVPEPVPVEPCLSWAGGRMEMGAAIRSLRTVQPELEQHDRSVLHDYYMGRSRTTAIAGRLGVSTSMVKVRLFRARRRLRVLLEREFRGAQQTVLGNVV